MYIYIYVIMYVGRQCFIHKASAWYIDILKLYLTLLHKWTRNCVRTHMYIIYIDIYK